MTHGTGWDSLPMFATAMESNDLSLLNPHPARLPGPGLLHQLVKPPCDALALEHLSNTERTTYSYQDLHHAADVLAAQISLALGRFKGQFVVPVLIRQSPHLYIALLAILKAGGAFCPLNIDAPPERVAFILNDVSATVIVASEELAPLVPPHIPVKVLLVDRLGNPSDLEHSSLRDPDTNDLAYVMYTSGSTGTPKGVGISHSAATQALLAHDRHVPAFSRFLQFAAPTFDVSIFEIFFPLYRGCALISANRTEMLNDLPAILLEMDVDACELTPTVAASLLKRRDKVPTLKLLLTIGEMLNLSVIQEFGGDGNRQSLLWAMYGPTEATIHCTVQGAFSSHSSTHNIGVPLDTVSCFVIEPAASPDTSTYFKLLPRGEAGELAVGGHQLAVGYLNRPEQTSSFILTPYGRVYRTGDKARINSEGTLECLGRLSEGQVKLRGQRLELSEVEAAVLRTPGCYGAVAAVLDSILVVFCSTDPNVTENVIIKHCRRWLPQFMIPGELVLMEEFPRLPSGKADKRILKTEFQERKAAATNGSGATRLCDIEVEVLRVVSEALDEEVNSRTVLASAGVDSLVAIKLTSSLRAAGFETSALELLSLKTVSDLCSIVLSRSSKRCNYPETANLSLLTDLDEVSRSNANLERFVGLVEDILPCSPLQVAMLAETAHHPESYWNEVELEAAEGISADIISDAIQRLARHNEILRAIFVPWRSSFVSLILKTFQRDQIKIVNALHGQLDVSEPDALLSPFRVQIQHSKSMNCARILIHIHHAIYDGWSMDIMLSELSSLLLGMQLSQRPQFRDFLQYFNSIPRIQSDGSKAFWAEHLLGWNKPPFPKLSARPAEFNQILLRREQLDIPVRIVENAAQKSGCSSQAYFQASLALVWGSILGATDILIGSVTSGRTVSINGIEEILGPLIASMPLRVNLANSRAILDLLMSIKSSTRSIMEHCTLPLSEIKKLAGMQTAAHLYDILFVYQDSLYAKGRKTSLFREIRHLDRLETKFLFEVEPQGHAFSLQATYHSDSFPPEVVIQMMQLIKATVENILNHSEGSIQSIRDKTVAELSVDNASPEELQEETLDLAKVFEAAVARKPEADAICFNMATSPSAATTMSFETLNRLSNQIANFLINQGAKPGHVVAIIMEKSPILYASILGIVKARCAYLPLLPSTPVARVQGIFESGNIQRCLMDKASLTTFEKISYTQLIDIELGSLESFSDRNLDIIIDTSRLAYVIYTSGTTGISKGVAVTQRNIVSNITHLASIYPISSRNPPRLLQACSQAFDVSVFEIFFTWHTGMCLCAAPNNYLFQDLEQAIRQFRITHLSLTPTVASLVEPKNVPRVEFLITAGEPMTASVLDKWGELLWQGYGPSETTNICSVKRMKPGEHIEHLGWVFPNTSVFVMAPGSLLVVPIGWIGEFCFGGEQVAAGYLNMPKLTTEKFVEHPEFGKIYRSGDMGRMLPDRSLVILGRIDDQLKLRGQRIEASEISSVIIGTAFAKAAVTTLVRRKYGGAEQLASFYVCSNTEADFVALKLDSEAHRLILTELQLQLPSYMVPSYLIPVSRIPLSSSGKVDRWRLHSCFESLSQKHLESVSSAAANHDTIEWSETETSVADVIANSLNISRSEIDRWTPFPTLGLDSISAIGVARDLNLQIASHIAISAILQNPTVAQLGRFIDKTPTCSQRQGQENFFPESFVRDVCKSFEQEQHGVAEILPCSPLQEAMLSYRQGSYFNKILLRIYIQSEEIIRCWNEMTKRHGILRTCFVTTSDAKFPIAQVVLKDWSIPWKYFNVNELSLEGTISEHLNSLSDPLETRLPPISMAIIMHKSSVFLSIICHHALYDGVAMENLWREVEALANGNELQPPVSYGPFIKEVLSLPNDTELFWKDHFRGFSQPNLFAQSPRRHINQCLHTISLDISFKNVQNRNRSLGVSLLSLSQAAWANALGVSSGLSDICFGCVVSGRTLRLEGLERLVAPCFNTIPVRKDLSAVSQNIDLVKSFQRLNLKLLQYQFTPLRLVQRFAGSNGRKLFDTLLLLQQPLQDMDAKIWTLEEDSGDMGIPLVCEVVPCPSLNSVIINIHYDMGIVDGDVAVALADIFQHIFQLMLLSPLASLVDRNSFRPTALPLLNTLSPSPNKSNAMNQPQLDGEKWTELETKIRRILSKLSGVQLHNVHRNTSIFQLGLDSINAVQVASMLRRQAFAVSASDVVECQNCTQLAERILEKWPANTSRPKYNLDKFSSEISSQSKSKLSCDAEIEAILPCTPLQCAMLASFNQSQGKNYLNLVSYAIDKTESKDDLIAAWKSLQTRHPMLRTGFMAVQHDDSAFAMVRLSATSATLRSIKFVQELDQKSSLPQWKQDVVASILDVQNLPPWRAALVSVRGGLTMHLLIHHALYDATSLDSMLVDLLLSLKGEATGNFPSVEPGLTAILGQSLDRQDEAQKFWQEKSKATVVNTFPIMTPLREDERHILSHETESSIPLSFLLDATQNSGVSIQAVIQAAWTRVLSSYLGEDSVVFGVTMSGRTMDETKDTPFPCMTTIPIVTSNRNSNAELVDYMMEYNANVHKYQFAPLSQVQKWLGHPASPIFDTLLVYQKIDKQQGNKRPWKLIKDDATVDYPMSLEVEPIDNNKVRLCITFFSDVLPKEQAVLLAQQFDAVMVHIATKPNGNEDEIYKIKPDIFSITPPIAPKLPAPVQFMHQFVETRALSSPHKTALEFVARFDGEISIKQAWTYSELDCIGNRVANLLRRVAPVESIVAIHFDKCPEAYFSILGILKAGCAFVALEPSAPIFRKEFIMNDSLAPCLLTGVQSLIDFDVNVKIIRIDMEILQQYSPERCDPSSGFTPNSTCYCLYTSGTTGAPKGCEITHENSVQAMMAFQELFKGHWRDGSRWLQFAALHFDVSILEQYWSWSVGITLVAAPKDLILDNLTAAINRLGITHIDLTPSLARFTHPDEVPGLCKGVFITGGEPLKQEILDAWGPKAVIYNAYGPTEATIGVTMFQRVPTNGRPSNIGKQFPNVGSYVFRRETEIPVLRGAIGELCVSGKLVGKGYLNRPELTKERFPLITEFGERIYRTGDLVRILHDGCFDFLGRADDQVKLRGQRLEIGEINHVIRIGAPEIADVATIIARHGSTGKDILVSFLVGQQTSKQRPLTLLPDDGKLGVKARAACREKLSGYMIPTYFLVLPYIPLSSNNKVEVKELKKLFNALSHDQIMALTAAHSIAWKVDGETRQEIINILSDFSRVNEEQIKEETSIFDLGVDSITTLQLSAMFKSRGFGPCTPTILLRNPIVADLTLILSEKTKTASRDSRVIGAKQTIQACHQRHHTFVCHALNVQAKDIEYIAPCSALQQGMISKSMAGIARGTYFNLFEMLLNADTSAERLQRAWRDLITSQAILRTAFVKTAEGYIQIALRKPTTFPWKEHVLEYGEDSKRILEKQRQDWIQRNNDHVTAPIELVLIKAPDFRKLVVYIFHPLYDGNSFGLMMERIKSTYDSKPLPPAPSFLEALSHGPLWRHDDCHQFWSAHLQGWKPSPISLLSSSSGSQAALAIRLIAGSVLEDVRKRHNVTMQSVLMASWTVVLQRYFPSGLTMGLVVAGRSLSLPNVMNTIGPLFNTLPFFNKTLKGHTWASLIRKCHAFNASILQFQHVPLKSIQKWESSGRPLFDNLFVFELERDTHTDTKELWKISDGPLHPDYPMALEAKRMGDGNIQLTLIAQGHIANVKNLEEILDQVDESVASMVTDAPLRISAEYSSLQLAKSKEEAAPVVNHEPTIISFKWTDEAVAVRDTIADLAGIPTEDITATQTMLEFGLDSIDAIQLSAKLRQKAIQLSAPQIMRRQTIAQMAQEIEIREPASARDSSTDDMFRDVQQQLWAHVEKAGVNLDDVQAVLPPTPLQESMVAGMMHSDFDWYFNHDLLELTAGVDISKLQAAWIQVVSQAPILRTGFLAVDDRGLDMGYCQVTYKRWAAGIEDVQVASLSDVHELIKDAKQKARDGHAVADLFQLRLVTCKRRRFVLVSMAHALYDGWSLDLMYRDLEAGYSGGSKARPSAAPFLQRILATRTDDASRFWAGYLDGVSPTILPQRHGLVCPGHALYRDEAISVKTMPEIADFCKKQAISLQALCQACWAMVLARRTQGLDVTFGIVLSGRDFEEAEELMFPTINTVALRCILHGTASDFLKYLEASMTDIRGYQAYPLRKIQASARLPGAELFNSLFMLQKSPSRRSADPLLKPVDGWSAVDYPVCVEAEAVDGDLIWRVACQSHYFTRGETEELMSDLDRALESMIVSETADILSFQGQGVSICGLVPVMLTENTGPVDDTGSSDGSVAESGQWTEMALGIRKALGYVSDIPAESIQAESTLYHLGLDSISAIKVSSLLRKEGIHLKPRDLVKATSIPEMARTAAQSLQIQSQGPTEASTAWKPAPDLDVDGLLATANVSLEDAEATLPALPMQVYMISAWQNAEGAVFFPEFRYFVDGITDRERIYAAWESLVAQTPMLRTCFVATKSTEQPFIQVILKPGYSPVGEDSLQPLVTFNVTEDIDSRQLLIHLRIHHALYDGFSLPAILQRFLDLLSGSHPAMQQGIQQWSRHTIRPSLGQARQARRGFWTDYLRGSPGPRAKDSKATGNDRVSYLKQGAVSDVSRLRSAAAHHGISMQALFFAAYAKALVQGAGARNDQRAATVIFGVYVANRASGEKLPSTYPTLNLIPLKVEAASNDSVCSIAAAIQRDIHRIACDGRADVGLWEIAAWTGVEPSSFVNFLSLPEDEAKALAAPHRQVKLRPARHGDEAAYAGREAETRTAFSRSLAQRNAVRNAFPASVDVEASIKGPGLDVGVFGSRQCTSDDGAAGLVEQIAFNLIEAGG